MKSPTARSVLDHRSNAGRFLVLTKKGMLDAVDALWVDPQRGAYELRPADLDLRVLSPLLGRLQPSKLLLSTNGDAPPRYLMEVPLGHKRKLVNAVGNVEELITRSLDNDLLPVLVEKELERGLARAEAGKALIPLHSIGVREHLPRALASAVRELALAHARVPAPKAQNLRDEVVAVRTGLRDTVLEDYLMKCIWLDRKQAQLGNLQRRGAGDITFRPFDTDSREITAFLCALEKDPYGDFLLDFREFAQVLPTPKRDNPWLGPTVHVFREDFREEHGLEERYSLYAGFRALSRVGAPVLVFEGHNPLLEPTDVRFLKISDRSLNLLQGRILEGNLLQEEVRSFTAQNLVWGA